MSLINRLIGEGMSEEEEARGKLPVHQCIAAWGERIRGALPFPWQELVRRFGLTAEEDAELQAWFQAQQQGAFTLQTLEQVLELAEAGYYTVQETKDRLGLT